MTKIVLVTGGAGFIGSHVVDRLVTEGYQVKILDNLSTGKLDNIQRHINASKVEFIKGDIRDSSKVKASLDGVSVVIHMAALVSVPLSIKDPDLTFDINLTGTMNLLRASVEKHVKRFVFISSCAVCGDPDSLPVTEKSRPNPISPYAESKLIGERYVLGFSERGLLPSVILRLFNVYGSRQGKNEYSGVITKFISFIKQKAPLIVYGDGQQTRDFINVKDVAAGILAAVKSDVESEIFNIGSGKSTSITELAETLSNLSGGIQILHEAPRQGDIKDSYADISKAEHILGFMPTVTFKDGLQALLNENKIVT